MEWGLVSKFIEYDEVSYRTEGFIKEQLEDNIQDSVTQENPYFGQMKL